MPRLLLGFALCLISLPGVAQERCAIVSYQKHMAETYQVRESEGAFEKWMNRRKGELRTEMRTLSTDAAAGRFVIPVVVHVIHKGESLGQGSNIPKEQILSQLATLNNDFRALNKADIDALPASFKSLAADTEIDFVLAKQDPEGLPTDGIIRVSSTEASWDQTEDLTLKGLSHWPPWLKLISPSCTVWLSR